MIVYLAGAIGAIDPREAQGWRTKARRLLELADIGVRCPMVNDKVVGPRRPEMLVDKEWAEGIVTRDMEFISESSALLVNASELSEGTAIEIYHAYHLGMPVVVFGYAARVKKTGEYSRLGNPLMARTYSAFLEFYATTFVEGLMEGVEVLKSIRDRTKGT